MTIKRVNFTKTVRILLRGSETMIILTLNFHIDKKSVDLPENGVVHLLEIFEVTFHLVQISVNVDHLVPHVHLREGCFGQDCP